MKLDRACEFIPSNSSGKVSLVVELPPKPWGNAPSVVGLALKPNPQECQMKPPCRMLPQRIKMDLGSVNPTSSSSVDISTDTHICLPHRSDVDWWNYLQKKQGMMAPENCSSYPAVWRFQIQKKTGWVNWRNNAKVSEDTWWLIPLSGLYPTYNLGGVGLIHSRNWDITHLRFVGWATK